MKKSAIIVIVIICMSLLVACVTESTRDNREDCPVKAGSPPGPDDNGNSKKTGAPEEIPIDSDYAVETYEFLKDELSLSHPGITLARIEKAFSQVVAGYMIILICGYEESGTPDEPGMSGDEGEDQEPPERNNSEGGEDSGIQYLYARVYYDLDGNREIAELIFHYAPETDE
jgi:hypothetical protein